MEDTGIDERKIFKRLQKCFAGLNSFTVGSYAETV
jgi:hypothetical protein